MSNTGPCRCISMGQLTYDRVIACRTRLCPQIGFLLGCHSLIGLCKINPYLRIHRHPLCRSIVLCLCFLRIAEVSSIYICLSRNSIYRSLTGILPHGVAAGIISLLCHNTWIPGKPDLISGCKDIRIPACISCKLVS